MSHVEHNTKVTRREVLRGVGAVGAAGLMGGAGAVPAASSRAGSTSPQPSAAPRPNIVLIFADDIGYSDIGCFGSEIATPNLDALAATGRRFTQMYNNPRCCPSRASLLTGLYPTQAGVGFLTGDQGSPEYQGYLNESCVTFAQTLGAAGYRTSVSGKWHVAPWGVTESLPHTRGFDRAFCAVGGNGYYRTDRYRNGEFLGVPTDPDYYLTERITGHAANAIREHASEPDPFVAFVAYTAPHYPLHARERDIAPYRGTYSQGWGALRSERFERAKTLGVVAPDAVLSDPGPEVPDWDSDPHHEWQDARMATYAAQITAMDRGIGHLMNTLSDVGAADNTLVLFLGDNGASAEDVGVGSHDDVPTISGEMRSGNIPGLNPGPSNTYQSYGTGWASASDSPFRRWKKWVHEGGIATPCVASWPASLSAGDISHSTMHVIDIMPTFLELAGADYPEMHQGNDVTPLEGESFAPLLTGDGQGDQWQRTKPIYWEHAGNRAVRDGQWKLVSDYDESTETYGAWELYDMNADRTEADDLASDNPDVVGGLSGMWGQWGTRVGVRNWHSEHQYRQVP